MKPDHFSSCFNQAGYQLFKVQSWHKRDNVLLKINSFWDEKRPVLIFLFTTINKKIPTTLWRTNPLINFEFLDFCSRTTFGISWTPSLLQILEILRKQSRVSWEEKTCKCIFQGHEEMSIWAWVRKLGYFSKDTCGRVLDFLR